MIVYFVGAVAHARLGPGTGLYVLALVLGMQAAAMRVRESEAWLVWYVLAVFSVIAGELLS